MPIPLAALAIPSIIGAVGSLFGAKKGANASRDAAAIQAAAAEKVAAEARQTAGAASGRVLDAGGAASGRVLQAGGSAAAEIRTAEDEALEILRSVYGEAGGLTQPYREAGAGAVTRLGDLAGEKFVFNPEEDPSYQFRLQEGLKALERSAAARGGLQSGGTLKGITRYAQDVASTEYQNAFNRFQQDRALRGQTLATLAGLGQTATGQQLAAGQNFAGQAAGNKLTAAQLAGGFDLGAAESAGRFELGAAETGGRFQLAGTEIAGNATMGGANATAAGKVGAANAWSSGIQGVANAASDFTNAWTLRDFLKPATPPYNPGAGYAYVVN